MLRPSLGIVRRRPIVVSLLMLLMMFGGFNVIVYRHAWAMLHFAPADSRRPSVDELSVLDKAGLALSGVQIPHWINRSNPGNYGLPYETVHLPVGNGGDLEAWHVPHQASRGLVLLFHGYAAGKSIGIDVARAFDALGYESLLVDFRGSGGSSGSDTTIGMREAQDVVASVTYARAQWPGRALVAFGQSMGSAAVLRALALDHLPVDAAVLESPFDRLLTTVQHRFEVLGFPAFPSARLLVFWGGVQFGFNGFQHNPLDYARSVNCPTLILTGDRDPFVTPEEARAVYENLHGPKALEVFPGLGHESACQGNPTRWRACVAAFLDRYLVRSERPR